MTNTRIESYEAFAIDRYKSKYGGRIVDMARPAVVDDDVLVQIHAMPCR